MFVFHQMCLCEYTRLVPTDLENTTLYLATLRRAVYRRKQLWKCLSALGMGRLQAHEHELLAVHWHWFEKAAVATLIDSADPAVAQSSQHLQYVTSKFRDALQDLAGGGANDGKGIPKGWEEQSALWKYGGHPMVPSKVALHKAHAVLDDLADSGRVRPVHVEDGGFDVSLADLVARGHQALWRSNDAVRDVTRASCAIRFDTQVTADDADATPNAVAESSDSVQPSLDDVLGRVADGLQAEDKRRKGRFVEQVTGAQIILNANQSEQHDADDDANATTDDAEDMLQSDIGFIAPEVILWADSDSDFVRHVLRQWVGVQLAPFRERSLARAECALVTELLQASNALRAALAESADTTAETDGDLQAVGAVTASLQTMTDRLSGFISVCLDCVRLGGPTSATDLAPHQQLLWSASFCRDLLPSSAEGGVMAVPVPAAISASGRAQRRERWARTLVCLQSTAAEIMSVAHDRMWCAPLMSGETALTNISPVVTRAYHDQDGEERMGGPHVLLQPGRLSAALHLLRSGGLNLEAARSTPVAPSSSSGSSKRGSATAGSVGGQAAGGMSATAGTAFIPVLGVKHEQGKAAAVCEKDGRAIQFHSLCQTLAQEAYASKDATSDQSVLDTMYESQWQLFEETVLPFGRSLNSESAVALSALLSRVRAMLEQTGAAAAVDDGTNGESKSEDVDSWASELAVLLASSSDPRIAGTCDRLILPCANKIWNPAWLDVSKNHSERQMLQARSIGLGWLYLGVLRYELYLPGALDPTSKPRIKAQVFRAECSASGDLATELRLGQMEERLSSGHCDNPETKAAERNLVDTKNAAAQAQRRAVERVSGPGMATYGEASGLLYRIHSTLLSLDQLLALCETSGSMTSRAEEVWQSNCNDALRQLARDGSYAHLFDVIGPLSSALWLVRSGVRMASVVDAHPSLAILPSPSNRDPWVATLHTLLDLPRLSPGMHGSASAGRVGAWASVLGRDFGQPSEYVPVAWLSTMLPCASPGRLAGTRRALLAAASAQLGLEVAVLQGVDRGQAIHLLVGILWACVEDWNAADEARRAREAAAALMYEYKETKHGEDDMNEEEEADERDFRKLFPDFHRDFDDVNADDDMGVPLNPEDVPLAASAEDGTDAEEATMEMGDVHMRMNATDMSNLCLMHRAMFMPATPADESEAAVAHDSLPSAALLAAVSSSVAAANMIWEATGEASARSRLFLAGADQWTLPSVLVNSASVASFYGCDTGFTRGRVAEEEIVTQMHKEGSILEAARIGPVVRPLLRRTRELMAAWPGNAVLIGLVRLCDRLLQLPLNAPLMQLLVGVELVHRKAFEWNQAASRDLRVDREMDVLVKLTMRWRKMELSGWATLLDTQEDDARKNARRLWTHVFSLIQRVEHSTGGQDSAALSANAGEWIWGKADGRTKKKGATKKADFIAEEETATSLSSMELFSSLDQMMRTSPLGEYSERLLIMKTFAKQLSRSQRTDTGGRISKMLTNIITYYEQFEGTVHAEILRAKTPIEKRLKGIAKISKWDPQTYFSLRQAAEKSHRQLHKCMKEFTEALKTVVGFIIDRSTDGGPISASPEQALDSLTKEHEQMSALPTPEKNTGKKSKSKMKQEMKANKDEVIDVADIHCVDLQISVLGSDASMADVSSFLQGVAVENASAAEKMDVLRQCIVGHGSDSQFGDGHDTKKVTDLHGMLTGRLPDLTNRVRRLTLKMRDPGSLLSTLQEGSAVPHALVHRIVSRCTRLAQADIKSIAKATAEAAKEGDDEGKVKPGKDYRGIEIEEEEDDDLETRLDKARRALKASKKMAVLDLLRGLRRQQLSHHHVTTVDKQKDICELFQLQSPLPHLAAMKGDCVMEAACSKGDTAGEYFMRGVAQLERLRVAGAGDMSPDMSRREYGMGLGFCENLLLLTLQQRATVGTVAKSCAWLKSLLDQMDAMPLSDDDLPAAPMSGVAVETRLRQQAEELSALGLSLEEVIMTVQAAHTVATDRAKELAVARAQVQSCAAALRNITLSLGRINASGDALDTHERAVIYPAALVTVLVNNDKQIGRLAESIVEWKQANVVPSEWVRQLESYLHTTVLPHGVTFAAHCSAAGSGRAAVVSEVANASSEDNDALDAMAWLQSHDAVIRQVLLAVQRIVNSSCATSGEAGIDDDDEGVTLVGSHEAFIAAANKLDTGTLCQKLHQVLAGLGVGGSRTDPLGVALAGLSANLRPMLRNHLVTARSVLCLLVDFHVSSCKLLFVLVRLFRTLVVHGFCVPEGSKQSSDGPAGGDGDMEDGTGMGGGEGAEDVSHLLDDEEQLLGLKGEEDPPEKENNEPAPDTGMEMENDFEGALQDAEKEDDGLNEEEEEEEEDPDREMGEMGDDEGEVLDEKMWDEEDQEEKDENDQEPQEEKYEDDNKISGEQGLTDEVGTKDDDDDDEGKDEKDDGKKDDKDEKPEPAGADDKPEDGAEAMAEDEGEDKNDEIHAEDEDQYEDRQVPVPQEQGHDDEDETLPEDMDLPGDDEGDEGDDGEEKLDEDEGEGDMPDDEVPGEDQEDGPGGETIDDEETQGENPLDADEEEDKDGDNDQDDADDAGANTTAELANSDDDEDPAADEEEDEEDGEGSPLRIEEDDAVPAAAPQEAGEDGQGGNAEAGEDEEEQDGTAGSASLQAAPQESQDKNEDKDEDDANEPEERAANADSVEGGKGEGGEWQHMPQREEDDGKAEEPSDGKKSKRNMEKDNPLRSPGEVLDQWQRRLDMIERQTERNDAEQDEAEAKEMEVEKPDVEEEAKADQTYEFAEGAEAHDQQVLAPEMDGGQGENKPILPDTEMDTLDDVDEETKGASTGAEVDPMQTDGADGPEEDDAAEAASQMDVEEGAQDAFPPQEEEDKAKANDDTAADDDADPLEPRSDMIVSNTGGMQQADDLDDEETKDPAVSQLEADLSEEDLQRRQEELRLQLKDSLESWQTINDDSLDDNKGYEIWAQLTQIIGDSPRQLCEQLRLILAPMLAAKMQGDYRTGKRINMRKVIPYIASHFKKDKIWLRRTKPSKRRYQVVVAIDDSESMVGDTMAGQLACEALAILTKAMAQLEVGEFAIMKFGKDTTLLHPFERPFTDEAGASFISQLTFKQQRTDYAAVVESLVSLLDDAAKSGPSMSTMAVEFMQLAFVISDGKIDGNREQVHKWVTEAEQRNQLLVLIILDNNAEKSIVSMKRWMAKEKRAQSYLEDYPFPYYIVLNDIARLPDVLCDALKQWFEIASRASRG
jgi:hypothetical protein